MSEDFLYTAKFLRSLRKMDEEVKNDVITAVEAFKKKQNHKRLNLRKLQGRMKKYHAFSANFYYRVVIKMEDYH